MNQSEKIKFKYILKADLARLFNPELYDKGNININSLRFLHPRFLPVLLIRASTFLYNYRFLKFLSFFLVWLNFFLFGVECTPKCKIGYGLVLPHSSGIVIGATSIGNNVTIFQGVTLGAQEADMSYDPDTRPSVGNGVTIGSGAKILGNVKIGNDVVIGANSVVLKDVYDSEVVGGIPAKIIKTKD